MGKKQASLSAVQFLASPAKRAVTPIAVVYGDEQFLRRECAVAIRGRVLQGEDAECSLSVVQGKGLELREVLDALMTLSLFSTGPRLVVVEDADPFVKQYRSELESYAEQPTENGVLLLDVKSWPQTTRLAKALARSEALVVECKTPPPRELTNWVVGWATSRHGVRIEKEVAGVLVDRAGSELGLLDQELAKLAVHVSDGDPISESMVLTHVGGWRVNTTWEMIDAALEGRAAVAMTQLGKLIDAGEEPHALLPMLASSLRKLIAAGTLIQQAEASGQRPSLSTALKQAGIPPFKIRDAERQLRQLGRERTNRGLDWLIESDLDIKGLHSGRDRARWVIERLIARLSTAADPRRS